MTGEKILKIPNTITNFPYIINAMCIINIVRVCMRVYIHIHVHTHVNTLIKFNQLIF